MRERVNVGEAARAVNGIAAPDRIRLGGKKRLAGVGEAEPLFYPPLSIVPDSR